MTFQHRKPVPPAQHSWRVKIAVLLGGGRCRFRAFAVLYGVTAWAERSSAIALEVGQRVEGRIVSISPASVPMRGAASPLRRGASGEVEFSPTQNSREVCRARVFFGKAAARIGQPVVVVPGPDSCANPVIDIGREPAGPYILSSLINAAAALMLGLWAWLTVRSRNTIRTISPWKG